MNNDLVGEALSPLFNNHDDRFGGHANLDADPPIGWVHPVLDLYGKEIPQTALSQPRDQDLYSNDLFMDIHLISEDGNRFKCHAFILSARSEFFRTLLTTRIGDSRLEYSKDRPLELHCAFSSIVIETVRDHMYVGLPRCLGLDTTPRLNVSASADAAFALPMIYRASQFYALPKLSKLTWNLMKRHYGLWKQDPWHNLVMLQSCMHHDVREGEIVGFVLCNIEQGFINHWKGYLKGYKEKPPNEILAYIGADCIELIMTHDSLRGVLALHKFMMLDIWAYSRGWGEDFRRAMAMVEAHIAFEMIPHHFFVSGTINYSGIASAEQIARAPTDDERIWCDF